MLHPFLSRFFTKKTSAEDSSIDNSFIDEPAINNPFEPLENDSNTIVMHEFTLYHRAEPLMIDLLIFLPHYGLYVGETILWKAEELKNAKVERSTRQSKKAPTTRLSSMEQILQQKLQDVLSFDSTPIERIIWMKNLTAEEFGALDSSFHELLPASRLIFSDDTSDTLLLKLHGLSDYQDDPYSTLKVIGSLQAHTLVLPMPTHPFGTFLSDAQLHHFKLPLENLPHIINGNYGTGKSTILLRKALQYLLENPQARIGILTPTLLHGELLLKELISLVEFAAVKCDLNSIFFYAPDAKPELQECPNPFTEVSVIFCDDVHLLNEDVLHKVLRDNQDKPVIMTTTFSDDVRSECALVHSYKEPLVTYAHCSNDNEALDALLHSLKHYHIHRSELSALIILPIPEMIPEYKNAIEEHFAFACETLDATFSLQYKSFGNILLSTPEHISGITIPHCYLINLDPQDPLYPLALSRASETLTIITQTK